MMTTQTDELQPPTQIFGPDFHRDPYPTFAWLREHSPVHEVGLPDGTSIWLLTRYDDALALLDDPQISKDIRRFRPDFGIAKYSELRGVLSGHMGNLDPPDHTRLRNLVAKVFTQRRVEAMRPRIQAIADELLSAIAAREAEPRQVDLVSAFCVQLPMIVICELLGIPEADREPFRGWATGITAGYGTRDAQFEAAGLALKEYLQRLIARKRADPGNDLLSGLVAVRDGDDLLTEDELISTVYLLLLTGQETAAHLIGTGVYLLLTHPEQLARLHADPSLVPSAVEEMLRFDGPVKITSQRFAASDLTIAGVTIPAGGLILVALPAINRDPRRFADPDAFDVGRPDNQHLGFAHGIHFCLAAALGRMEGQIAIASLLARFPSLSLAAPQDPPLWAPGILVRGLEELVVTY